MKIMTDAEVAEWAMRAGEAGAFLFDKYCQKFRDAGLRLDIDMNVGMASYITYTTIPQAWLRIVAIGRHGYRYVKSVYVEEKLDIVQLICTMEDILKEYKSCKSKRK